MHVGIIKIEEKLEMMPRHEYILPSTWSCIYIVHACTADGWGIPSHYFTFMTPLTGVGGVHVELLSCRAPLKVSVRGEMDERKGWKVRDTIGINHLLTCSLNAYR
jgi:hypothetical protein